MKVKYELSPEDVKRAIREYLGLKATAKITFNISNDFTDRYENERALKFEGVEIEDEAKEQAKKRPSVKKETPSQLSLMDH